MPSLSPTIELSQQLIRCPSVTPDDANCQILIGERLAALGFANEPMRFGDVDNLWSRLGAKAPLFVFAGHTDVVPVGDDTHWRYPPFSATVADERLWGRGAADMKSSLAAMVIAVERFLQHHRERMTGSLGFLLTSDEEGPAVDGTVKVVEALQRRGESIDLCIVGEPTSSEITGDVIKNGRRGSLNGEMTLRGTAGHVAYPHLADNPIHKLGPLITKLSATHWDDGNRFFPPTTFQISNLRAGAGATNVIPASTHVTFNFRFSPESSADSLRQRVHDICRDEQLDFEIQWTLSGNPFQTDEGTLTDAVGRAIRETAAIDTELSTTGGTSDARFIAPTGAQVIELGPPNATIHKTDENVRLTDIDTLTDVYEACLRNTLL